MAIDRGLRIYPPNQFIISLYIRYRTLEQCRSVRTTQLEFFDRQRPNHTAQTTPASCHIHGSVGFYSGCASTRSTNDNHLRRNSVEYISTIFIISILYFIYTQGGMCPGENPITGGWSFVQARGSKPSCDGSDLFSHTEESVSWALSSGPIQSLCRASSAPSADSTAFSPTNSAALSPAIRPKTAAFVSPVPPG